MKYSKTGTWLRKAVSFLCGAVIAVAPINASGAISAADVNFGSITASGHIGRAASENISDKIGLSANLFCIDGSDNADHAAIQWGTTLKAEKFILYRSAYSANGYVPIYEGTGSSFTDADMQIGETYYYQLSVLEGDREYFSSVKELTACVVPSGLSTYDNQKGSSLVYETSGFRSGDKYYSYAFRTHAGTNSVYLAESVSNDGRSFGSERNVADSSQNSALASCKLESVHIEFVPTANKVVIWAHWEQPSGYADGKALVITGTPGGQFTVHHVYNPFDIQVRDMAVFFDDDNAHTGYLIAAANKAGQGANATIYIFRMNADYSGVTEIVKTLHENQYREFPNLIKRDGYYFLFTSQAAGWYPSSGAYTVTDNLYGEWSELRPIGNTSTFSSQSGWVVNLKDRNYLMHAYRWLRGAGTSGTTLCPLYFDNGFAFYDYYPYFRYNTSTGDLYPVQIGELLSQDKTAAASLGAKAENSADKAVDGSYQSCFAAIGDFKKWPFYIQVDLEKVCELKNIQTSWYICKGSEGYYMYTVEGSLDGKNWTVLYDHTDESDETVSKTYGFNSDMISGKARYVRLNVKGARLQNNPNNNWYTPTVYEMKVFGTPVGESSAPKPAAVYDFENANGGIVPDKSGSGNDLRLFGSAAVASDASGNKVLRLDGTEGGYAQLPTGILDGCTDYTVIMDVKSEMTGDFFTFTVGKNDTAYSFFKVADDHFRFATSTNSWRNESGIRYDLNGTSMHRYILTVSGGEARLYVDGKLVSEVADLTSLLKEMGSSLECYIGKSLYAADPYFKGTIDNVSVYAASLNPKEIEAITKIKGDVNADGSFNAADLVTLSKWLHGSGTIADGKASDLNGDGHTDIFDMAVMRKLLIIGGGI